MNNIFFEYNFIEVLKALGYKHSLKEIDESFNECIQSTRDFQKQSTFTLRITIKPGDNGQTELQHKVTSKLAGPNPSNTVMFLTPEGKLTIDDPNQNRLDL